MLHGAVFEAQIVDQLCKLKSRRRLIYRYIIVY